MTSPQHQMPELPDGFWYAAKRRLLGPKILLVISVPAILLMCLGNLRGIREAGRIFALPTYLFAVSVIAMIVAGVVRQLAGGLPHVQTGPGTVSIGSHSGLIAFGALYIRANDQPSLRAAAVMGGATGPLGANQIGRPAGCSPFRSEGNRGDRAVRVVQDRG